MGCFPSCGKSFEDDPDQECDGRTNFRRGRRVTETRSSHHGTSERREAGDGEEGNRADVRMDEVPLQTRVLIDGKEIDLAGLIKDGVPDGSKARMFTFKELVAATGNFRPDCFLGEGGFGKVYKGYLSDVGQEVAIKQLDPNGLQGTKEFIVEVTMLSMVDHPNLVKLIGFCVERDQKHLVYEFMPLRSLEAHLHDLPQNTKGLDWYTRMKIAAGAAKGLEYLHDKVNPPIIHRDLKSANVLLGEEYHPKLSDFGLAKVGPTGDRTHVSTRVMGTYGYCAPDYAMTGQLNFKSDIYSFGVVLLELISGRKAYDPTKDSGEQNLVDWARPLFRDRKTFPLMADPSLERRYPVRGLHHALAITAMCVHRRPSTRPVISEVVSALTYLASREHEYGHPARIPGEPSSSSMTGKEDQVTAEGIADEDDENPERLNLGD
ncbi:hypothetical protein MLD38_040143 [Melastoma candidum]|uniref:Uncharacterized protein n=1 Tax=Melastoma candidum TaxID=119954 RepID=A0ACB9L5I2_9MYRT|nr:hypothetical protein MLD38_040143 [Melastoma candidum]